MVREIIRCIFEYFLGFFLFAQAFKRISVFLIRTACDQADQTFDASPETARIGRRQIRIKLGILGQVLRIHHPGEERFRSHDLNFGINFSRPAGDAANDVSEVDHVSLFGINDHRRFRRIDGRRCKGEISDRRKHRQKPGRDDPIAAVNDLQN
ncbi:MAG: hypothetical protein AAGA97_10260 [Pseudomonadota bacterium]